MNSKKKSLHVKVNSDTFEMVEQYRKNRKLNRSVAVERLLFLAGTVLANMGSDKTLEDEIRRAGEDLQSVTEEERKAIQRFIEASYEWVGEALLHKVMNVR